MTSFVKKYAQKRCWWNYCNIWPNWFTSHQSHWLLILQRHTGIFEEKFKVNSKIIISNKAKYLKFHFAKVESTRNGKLRWLSRRFQTLIWNGSKSWVFQIIRESWQPCGQWLPWNNYVLCPHVIIIYLMYDTKRLCCSNLHQQRLPSFSNFYWRNPYFQTFQRIHILGLQLPKPLAFCKFVKVNSKPCYNHFDLP